MMLSLTVSELVKEVLGTVPRPYREDITDRVCLEIEKNPAWHARYDRLVASHDKGSVNRQIGRSTLQLTGLRNLGVSAKATSKLIGTYTRLG
jgi:hypothetical protein